MTSEELETIRAKYIGLHKLYHEMVGNLYPSIIYAELIALRDRYRDGLPDDARHGWWGDLPPVRPPNESGYVD